MDRLPPLVDQYGHGVLHGDLGLGAFEAHLAAASGGHGPAPAGTTFFDSWTGLGVRRWCPPLLGLEAHCPPARYLARRRELGAYRATRLLLRGSGIATFLLAAGAPSELTSAAELAAAAEAGAHEVIRLEPLAEQIADTSGSVDSFIGYTAEAVYAATQDATAFASAAAFCEAAPRRRARCGAPPTGGCATAGRESASPTRRCCGTCCGARWPPASPYSCTAPIRSR